jgi:hypothetical protein
VFGDRYLGSATFGKGMGEHIPWWLGGHIIRFPGRLLQAIDDFFKVLAYRAGIRAHAYRMAWSEFSYTDQNWNKLRGVRSRYLELAKHPTPEIRAQAENEAKTLTFQQSVDPMWRGIPELAQSSGFFKILVPFSTTLLNSVEFVMSGTPIGAFIFKRSRESLMGMHGRAAQDMAIAHILVTSGTAYAIYLWAMAGNVSAPFKKDERGRTIQGISGTPPLSVKIPGTNQWVSVNRVDPMGAIVALGANAAEATKRAEVQGDQEAAQSAFFVFMAATFTMLTDRAGFKGLIDFADAFRGGTYGNDQRSWQEWTNNLAATLTVPQIIAVNTRVEDPALRYARTYLEKVYARLDKKSRESLWPVRDMWGDIIIGYDSFGSQDWLDRSIPLYFGQSTNSPQSKAMILMYKLYGWAPGSLDRNVAGRRMTEEQYDYYATQVGKHAFKNISELISRPEWARAEYLDKAQKKLRREVNAAGASRNYSPEAKRKWQELKKQYLEQAKELHDLRYKALQQFKKAIAAARQSGRQDAFGSSDPKKGQGRFPEFWKLPRLTDDFAKSGETSDWFDSWFDADDQTSQWEAEQERQAESYDGQHDETADDAPPPPLGPPGEDPALTAAKKRHEAAGNPTWPPRQ